uniref:Uncharacterized protein n=1 Tax=Pseudo-nitzschia australis TaxID=44445 RepID=A0A6V0ASV0_9STRA|mmetsp:Transcript_25808/g.56591  ORF Transcript_25808/g.56591 Transcript_25808/m.56591 type:complete len:406 (+) Transcript_25808:116-1333(+)
MIPESPTISPGASGDDKVAVSTTNPDVPVLAKNSPSSGFNARSIVGGGMDRFTALINDNIIAARYGVFATIALLTVYGISNTPLFFRYRTVAEIPKSFFVGRRRLYCRIIGVHRDANANHVTRGTADMPIQITVRNLSPIGMLLPTSWFESLMRISPSSGNFSRGLVKGGGKAEESKTELLRLQIAGIFAPPVSRDSYDPVQVLERLAKKRTLVSCQLLGREVLTPLEGNDESAYQQNIQQSSSSVDENNSSVYFYDDINSNNEVPTVLDGCQVALCKITYRPQFLQIFPTDLAETLVEAGNGSVASNLLFHSSSPHTENCKRDDILTTAFKREITDASQRIQDIRNDVKYLDKLAILEFEAAQKSKGMWSVPEVRQMKKEIVDEVDFQAEASLLQKIWRRIQGG